ncbi:MAG: metallophosphoesterase [Deltaproteobacteria bacterium]|nr:metallophosphoesterase [Deltaproteobacteria bacterium]
MDNISRRKFIKKSVLTGAALTAFPGSFLLNVPGARATERDQPLLTRPYLGRPTTSSITVNLVAGEEDIACHIRFRRRGGSRKGAWKKTEEYLVKAFTPMNIPLEPLLSDSNYEYEVYARRKNNPDFWMVARGTFRTQRTKHSSFSFAVFSDAHIAPFYRDRMEVLREVGKGILARKPEFAFMLGDNIQTFTSHGSPMTEPRFGPILYSALRHALGELPSSVPVYKVLGNWEGENGWHPDRERGWARNARTAWIPNPGPGTYPEGGSGNEDYYAFTWGDVLFIALNVTGYTASDHAMQSPGGRADDWTLGKEQREWLHESLSRSKAKWKLIFIHHTVGGNAGDDVNSRYGRGGGRAARVGEQAVIHRWMKEFGVQALFYGHDHVFTDIPVDGIHYVCVGSAGAPWKFPESVTGYKRYWTPSGCTWVDVEDDRLEISFVKPDVLKPVGEVLHSFEIVYS